MLTWFVITICVYLWLSAFATSRFREFTDSTLPLLFGNAFVGAAFGFGTVVVIHKIRLTRNRLKWEGEFNDYKNKVLDAFSNARNELLSTHRDVLYRWANDLKEYLSQAEGEVISLKVHEYKEELLERKRALIRKIDELVQGERELCPWADRKNVHVLWNDPRGSSWPTTTVTISLKSDARL
jgi:hypothetical protein